MGETFVAKPKIAPDRGLLTWEAEGHEGGTYHSRKLHVPSGSSGVTIGRGYDMKEKNPGKIQTDLVSAGVPLETAKTLSAASTKKGDAAKSFIKDKKIENFEISQETQRALFDITYKEIEKDVKRICEKSDVVEKYGKTDWENLNQSIKDILIDLRFRGDYTPSTRRLIQKYVSANDVEGLAKAISNSKNWTTVPTDRFKRRKEFANEAAAKAISDKAKELKLPPLSNKAEPAAIGVKSKIASVSKSAVR